MNKQAEEYTALIEKALAEAIPQPEKTDLNAQVIESMRYSLLLGGKRIRPVMTLAFCKLCGEEPLLALPFACAIEMVHTYSLIHDDLPCMDNDDLRRGKLANHKIYGDDIALIAGDGLLTKAFETALSFKGKPEASVLGAKILAEYSGDHGMVGGQCIDLQSSGKDVSLDVLRAMDQGKTVALITAACVLGCVAAGADDACAAAARKYANGVGMAFQLRDDILDVLGDADKLGKNTGMDKAHSKSNYVSLLGVEETQRLVTEYTQEAVLALETFPGDAEFLRDLAISLAEREN